jgi:CheY-like chemotaxis protein
MVHKASVLIVDTCIEAREVLRTALERRGLQTLEASGAQLGLDLARQHQPDLIVLDLETVAVQAGRTAEQFQQALGSDDTPLVALGSARRTGKLLSGEFVAKPYHYGPLIHKIEQLLESSRRPTAPGNIGRAEPY